MYHLVLTPSLGPLPATHSRCEQKACSFVILPCHALLFLLRPSRHPAHVMQYYFELFFLTHSREHIATTRRACCSPAPIVLEIHLVATIAGVRIRVKPIKEYTVLNLRSCRRKCRPAPTRGDRGGQNRELIINVLAFTSTCNYREGRVLHP